MIRAVAVTGDGKSGPSVSQTYLFPDDILLESSTGAPPPGWPSRWGRGRARYGLDERIINDPKLRPETLLALRSLPSCSVVVDPADLWNSRRGLYSVPEAEGRTAERLVSLEPIHSTEAPDFKLTAGLESAAE